MSLDKGRIAAHGRREAEQEDHRPSDRGTRVRRFWDSELSGFGIRVHATGRKLFVAQARTPGGLPKRATVGRYEDIDAEDARLKAAAMIDRIRRGRDPVPPPVPAEPTVADLAERFMTAHVRGELQAGHGEELPEPAQAVHPPRSGRSQAERGRPLARLGAAPRPARHAVAGEPVGGHVLEDVRAGGCVGHDAGPAQPLPVDQALQGAELRALPDGRTNTPGWAGCCSRPSRKARSWRPRLRRCACCY